MKTTQYIKPQTEVVLIKTYIHLLPASSNKIVDGAESVVINPSTMEGGDGIDAASRRSIWGDDDEF